MDEENTADEREPLPGEAEYVQARQMPRHAIPTFAMDGEYLELLGKSAALGFPRAQAKLGEYAMRRGGYVEAYYWFRRARKGGMAGLDSTLREIRKRWVSSGLSSQSFNRHELFTETEASAALALLDLASGRNRARARAFLQEHCPDLVD